MGVVISLLNREECAVFLFLWVFWGISENYQISEGILDYSPLLIIPPPLRPYFKIVGEGEKWTGRR